MFGYPAINSYLEKAVMFQERTSSSDADLEPPAITICVDTQSSLKKETSVLGAGKSMKAIIQSICGNNTTTVDKVMKCFEYVFYNSSELIVKQILNGKRTVFSWNTDITVWAYGKCHSLVDPPKIGVESNESIRLNVKPNLPYRLFIHDRKFFFPSGNPLTIPGVAKSLIFPSSDSRILYYHFQHIKASKIKAMDREGSPCMADADYSFSKCLKKFVEKKIGCVVPWNTKDGNMKCTKLEQITNYLEIYRHFLSKEQQRLVWQTGCKVPCIYTKYEDVGSSSLTSKIGQNEMRIQLNFASTQVTIKKEVYVYPFLSLLAEFGGALGMFLGFSFLMIWDVMKLALMKYWRQVNAKSQYQLQKN